MTEKWGLKYGIHRNSIISRDSDYSEFDNCEDAIKSYHSRKKFHNEMGYFVWYAIIVAPDGTSTMLERNTYDR